ncbi:MAG: DUF4230 domain-containing protein [Solibacillus sp.]
MSKKDEALNELKKGKDEQAATIAVGQSRRRAGASTSSSKLGWIQIVFLGAFLIVVTAGGTWLVAGNVFNKESTVKQETTVFVEQVRDLATLATTEAHLKVVMKVEDNKLFGKNIPLNLPGTKRELLLIVPATVIAGVDLKGITSDDFVVNEDEKELEIVLPHAAFIQEPAIQMDGIETFSDEGLFRSEVKWDEGYDLAAVAQDKIIEEATKIHLLQSAEQSAEKVLEGFFDNLGYAVKITFK